MSPTYVLIHAFGTLRDELDRADRGKRTYSAWLREFVEETPKRLTEIAWLIDHLSENGWRFTQYRKHVQRGSLHYTHDTGSAGKYAVYRNLETYGHSVVAGHTHRLAYIVEGNAKGDVRLSTSFGWLGDIDQVDYMHRAKALRD